MAKATVTDIRKSLEKATGIEKTKDEDVQTYLRRLIKKVSAIDDDGWEGLSEPAKNWFNEVAPLYNKNETLPSLFEEEAEAAPKGRSRVAVEADEPEGPADPKVGDQVIVTLEDGEKVQGEVLEITERSLVIDSDGDEEVIKRSKVKAIKVKGATAGKAADEPAKAKDPEVGDVVEVTMEDGESFKGEFIEDTARAYVLTVKGEEEVLSKKKVKSIKVTASDAKAETKSSTRSSTKDDAGEKATTRGTTAKAKDKDDGGEKAKPATVRIREIMCEDPDLDKAAVQKQLDKEGVEVKGTTLDITFSEVSRTISLLRQFKRLK